MRRLSRPRAQVCDSCGERRDPILAGCPLTSTHMMRCVCKGVCTHTEEREQIKYMFLSPSRTTEICPFPPIQLNAAAICPRLLFQDDPHTHNPKYPQIQFQPALSLDSFLLDLL